MSTAGKRGDGFQSVVSFQKSTGETRGLGISLICDAIASFSSFACRGTSISWALRCEFVFRGCETRLWWNTEGYLRPSRDTYDERSL